MYRKTKKALIMQRLLWQSKIESYKSEYKKRVTEEDGVNKEQVIMKT